VCPRRCSAAAARRATGPAPPSPAFQLTALAGAPSCVPIVRVTDNDPARFKRALDMGACGVMVPLVNSAAEARAAVRAMRYPPAGDRGVARTTRATLFGRDMTEYYDTAAARLVLMVQIETAAGVAAAGDIAAVDGVDVLFVGPTDLGVALAGAPIPFDDARLAAVRQAVALSARAAGKRAGILCSTPEHVAVVREEGFSVVMIGSDMSAAAVGVRGFAAALRPT
jgi:4-hydroxy-2-oxoheptanedioate aldolase